MYSLNQRSARASAMAKNIDDFIARGGEKLARTAGLPALIFGLENLAAERNHGQITAAESLHYIFLDSDVFSEGVFLLNHEGRILWSEPPDLELLDTQFPAYPAILNQFATRHDRAYFVTTTRAPGRGGLQTLISAPSRGTTPSRAPWLAVQRSTPRFCRRSKFSLVVPRRLPTCLMRRESSRPVLLWARS